MHKSIVGVIAAVSLTVSGAAAIAANISGAGATFPAPVYAKWAEAYKGVSGNALNYQAIGSGGGIKQIEANTVDFGATDKPLHVEDLTKNGLVQFPMVIGGIVPVMNLPGIRPGEVKLTGAVIADIYRGIAKRWNDPEIASRNPGVKLPNLPITVVHRSDGSGTTFLFTSYLSLEAAHWRDGPGASDSVDWPVGIGGKGNDGVAAFVKQTPGAIGYVEYAYAKQNRMVYAEVQNKAGKFVEPTAVNFAAAAAGAQWNKAPGFYLLLLDQPGATAWPITGATFILMHAKQSNAETGHDVLAFFDWCYKNGNPQAESLDYVPLPDSLKSLVRSTAWTKVKGANGSPVYK